MLPVAGGFVDNVMFSHSGADTDTGHWRIIHRDPPDGAGELRTRGEVCYRRAALLF